VPALVLAVMVVGVVGLVLVRVGEHGFDVAVLLLVEVGPDVAIVPVALNPLRRVPAFERDLQFAPLVLVVLVVLIGVERYLTLALPS